MQLQGSFAPPGDKSISHRLALMALLAKGWTGLENLAPGRDVATSLRVLETLGGTVQEENGRTVIQGPGRGLPTRAELDCGNSGTTMRLLMGLLAGIEGQFTLDGDESLRKRPMERVARPLRMMGAGVECTAGRCPVRIKGGPLLGISYEPPVASAQLKSAILLAGLQARGITEVWEPAPSRDHTERLIYAMGGKIEVGISFISLLPSALTLPEQLRIPGDPSSAAFFLCPAAVLPGSRVTAQGMLLNRTRTGFLKVLKRMGAKVEILVRGRDPEPWGDIRVEHGGPLTGCKITPNQLPGLIDEVPILALAATQARGKTVFEGIQELRLKETDRVAALVEELTPLGLDLKVVGDNLVVTGQGRPPAPPVRSHVPDSRGDHRMAMTLRLALLMAGDKRPIRDEDCAAISYPDFGADLGRLLG